MKILFSSSPTISFYLDTVYWAGGVSAFLMKTSNSSIKKQISHRTIIFACSRYFLGCPRPRLTEVREAKVAEIYLAASSIGDISAGDISIWGILAGVGLSSTGCRLSIK